MVTYEVHIDDTPTVSIEADYIQTDDNGDVVFYKKQEADMPKIVMHVNGTKFRFAQVVPE